MKHPTQLLLIKTTTDLWAYGSFFLKIYYDDNSRQIQNKMKARLLKRLRKTYRIVYVRQNSDLWNLARKCHSKETLLMTLGFSPKYLSNISNFITSFFIADAYEYFLVQDDTWLGSYKSKNAAIKAMLDREHITSRQNTKRLKREIRKKNLKPKKVWYEYLGLGH